LCAIAQNRTRGAVQALIMPAHDELKYPRLARQHTRNDFLVGHLGILADLGFKAIGHSKSLIK